MYLFWRFLFRPCSRTRLQASEKLALIAFSYLAQRADVNPEREFFLLAVLGADLPGALVVEPLEHEAQPEAYHNHDDESRDDYHGHGGEEPLRFSLAGLQLKFSAVMEASGGLTIPVDGMGGSWIVKLPSARFKSVPENEFAMLELARRVGISIPDNKLVEIASIKGLPEQAHTVEGNALAVKRFDRLQGGEPIHMEDFAQVFGIYPNHKEQIPQLREYCRRPVGGIRRTGRRGVRPPPGVLRGDRQRRHAPQELVADLSRPAQGRARSGL
jgi:hypothetical protein